MSVLFSQLRLYVPNMEVYTLIQYKSFTLNLHFFIKHVFLRNTRLEFGNIMKLVRNIAMLRLWNWKKY